MQQKASNEDRRGEDVKMLPCFAREVVKREAEKLLNNYVRHIDHLIKMYDDDLSRAYDHIAELEKKLNLRE